MIKRTIVTVALLVTLPLAVSHVWAWATHALPPETTPQRSTPLAGRSSSTSSTRRPSAT